MALLNIKQLSIAGINNNKTVPQLQLSLLSQHCTMLISNSIMTIYPTHKRAWNDQKCDLFKCRNSYVIDRISGP